VAEQRRQYKAFTDKEPNTLTGERIELLDGLGFAEKAHEVDGWDGSKAQLQEYCNEHGHCNVPLGHPKYPGLGTWVQEQRRLRQGGQLTEERVSALEKVGFDWGRDQNSKRQLSSLGADQEESSVESLPLKKRRLHVVSV